MNTMMRERQQFKKKILEKDIDLRRNNVFINVSDSICFKVFENFEKVKIEVRIKVKIYVETLRKKRP
jgi:hypothetical protein